MPDEPVPLAGEVAGTLDLPCAEEGQCPVAEFAPTVTLYPSARGQEKLVSQVEKQHYSFSFGYPQIPDPVNDGSSRVRAVCSSDVITIEVFVDQGALLDVVTDFVLATPNPRRAKGTTQDPEVGVSLAPGAVVDVVQTKGDQVKVDFEEEVVKGSGWIPKAVIGKTYRNAESDSRDLPDHDRIGVQWEKAIPVKDRPGGRTFATIRGPATIQPLGETRNKHLLGAVSFALEERTYAIGWLAESAISAGKRRGGIVGGVLGGMPSPDATMVAVPEGTRLHSNGGHSVAVATGDTTLECISGCETRTPVVRLRCVADFPAKVVAPRGG